MGLLQRFAEQWEEVFGERRRHRQQAQHEDTEDQKLNELIAEAEEMKAKAMRKAANRRESRGLTRPDKLHSLADDAEARASLYREMGLEQEEYETLTENEGS